MKEGTRKFTLAAFGMLLVAALPLVPNAVVEKMYAEAVSGIVFLFMAFGGANVGEHWSRRKGGP